MEDPTSSITRAAGALFAVHTALLVVVTGGCTEADPTSVAGAQLDAPIPAQARGAPDQTGKTVVSGTVPICDAALVVDYTITTITVTGALWFGPLAPNTEARRNLLELTNPENGKGVRVPLAGRTTREILEFYDDGSFLAREPFVGKIPQIQGPTGPPLSSLKGSLSLDLLVVPQPDGTFDSTGIDASFNGTDPADASGPSDHTIEGELWCEIVVGALT